MESLEVSAKTVEEAIECALEQLGVSQEEAEVVVLKKGKAGVFGLGAEEAVVRVSRLPCPPSEEGDIATAAKEIAEKLLALMNMPASVHLAQSPEAGADSSPIALDIRGEELGILIGRRGQTLSSLQYIINLIMAHRLKARLPVIIDVEGYKQRRCEALRGLALRLADQVKATGRTIALEPMSAYERRIIHLALADHPDVATQSMGEGEARKVAILLKRE